MEENRRNNEDNVFEEELRNSLENNEHQGADPSDAKSLEVDAENMDEVMKAIEEQNRDTAETEPCGKNAPEEYSFRDEQNFFVNPGKNQMKSSYPEQEPAAELIYNAEKGTGAYTCDYAAQPPKKRAGALRVWALIIAAAFTLSFMAFTGFMIAEKLGAFDSDDGIPEEVFHMDIPSQSENTDDEVEEVVSVAGDKKALTLNQIAEKCTPSAVGIMVEATVPSYFGMTYTTKGVGSGFILSEDGYIATNNHVIDGATSITVVLNDGTEHEAKLIGADAITDIAVVKIEATGLPVMERGNSDDLRVGDLAVAIGTPAQIKLAGTFTDGIISAVNRKIDITDGYGRVVKTMNLIQTNATINPGNSGGPLINRYGQVIGINTLKLTAEYEGIGFAIPINGAIKIMNQLITDGKVSDRSDGLVTGKASIGIQGSDITEDEAKYYGIPRGVLVIQINKNGAAAGAGLRRGDIIVKFNGKKVQTMDELNSQKTKFNPGDEVTITVYRDGEGELDITFKLDMQTE
ncbi:MAG: trypsin-like peptidase domain-containing protein [Clostridia bacterium]|nr:trypsin-like peptidase domain-containing protein [Clostridia bacterium]